ncbi:MAG: SgcJ/EcaC family oxidoreductase, partial [Acidobacteriota bacterium]
MRTLWIWMSVLALAAPALAQGTEAEEAIETMIQGWAGAWNNGDIPSIAELYTADADYISFTGEVVKGREEIEKAFAELNSGPYKGSKVTLQRTSIRFVKPDLV